MSFALGLLNMPVSEHEIALELNPERGEGVGWLDLTEYLLNSGLDFSYHRNKSFDDLLDVQLLYQSPILVQWYSERIPDSPGYHVSVVYAINESEILLMDPTFRDYYPLSREDFEKVWRDADGESSFIVVHPGDLRDSPSAETVSLPDQFHPGSDPIRSTSAAALAYAFRALGKAETSAEEIEHEMGTLPAETCWFDMVMNTAKNGYGSAFHSNSNYRELVQTMQVFQAPIIVIWKAGDNPEDPAELATAVIQSIDLDGVVLMDPLRSEFWYVERNNFESRWMDQDNLKSFLVVHP